MNTQHNIRKDEFKRSVDSQKYYENNQKEMIRIDKGSMSKNLHTHMCIVNKEMKIEEALRNAEKIRFQRDAERVEKENEIQSERSKFEKEYKERMMRQQIRENSQELRELESKLRTAYISKHLAIQTKEKDLRKMEAKILMKKENEELEKERILDLERLKLEEIARKENQKKLGEALKEQIIFTYQKRKLLYLEFLKEKSYLDAIAIKIEKELHEDMVRRHEWKLKTKRELDFYHEKKKEWDRVQEEQMNEENERIKQYCEERERYLAEQEMKRKELEEKRDCINYKMVAELSEIEETAKQRQELLQELWAFEQNEKEERKMRETLETRFRMRIQTRLALEQQLLEQHQRKQNEVAEDKVFKQQQLQMMAERDKIDLMSNERRRIKQVEHRKAFQQLLDDRKRQRAEDIANVLKEHNIAREQEQKKLAIIEEERIKMLKEHANDIIGFLPPGVLRESDREFLPLDAFKSK